MPAVNRSLPLESSAMSTCASQIRAGAHTTCQFADNVMSAFESSKGSTGVFPVRNRRT